MALPTSKAISTRSAHSPAGSTGTPKHILGSILLEAGRSFSQAPVFGAWAAVKTQSSAGGLSLSATQSSGPLDNLRRVSQSVSNCARTYISPSSALIRFVTDLALQDRDGNVSPSRDSPLSSAISR